MESQSNKLRNKNITTKTHFKIKVNNNLYVYRKLTLEQVSKIDLYCTM